MFHPNNLELICPELFVKYIKMAMKLWNEENRVLFHKFHLSMHYTPSN